MAHIKTRNPSGGEYSFYSQDEFVRAIRRGAVNQDWEVFHSSSGQWLPITAHPAFSPAHANRTTTEVRLERSSELVLIYPPEGRPAPAPKPPERGRDPIDSGPHVTLAEIERVLGAPLTQPADQPTPEGRSWSARQSGAADRPQAPHRKSGFFSVRAALNNVRVLQRLLIVTTLLGLTSLALTFIPGTLTERVVSQVHRVLFGDPSSPSP